MVDRCLVRCREEQESHQAEFKHLRMELEHLRSFGSGTSGAHKSQRNIDTPNMSVVSETMSRFLFEPSTPPEPVTPGAEWAVRTQPLTSHRHALGRVARC